MGTINIDKLNPHPKNEFYFTDVSGEKYEEIKESIRVNGMRDEIVITTSYTIISGHQRIRIARDLGWDEVPVEIKDVNEWDAEYLLIACNRERRGESESDPIKKARQIAFLKEYKGVKHGGERSTRPLVALKDIADTIGEPERTVQRLNKLNDLIPDIQSLVSSKKLGVRAAEQLAFLTVEEQSILFEQKGESLGEMTVEEMKNLRKEVETLRKENNELKNENKKLVDENSKLKNASPKTITKTVEKLVDNTDHTRINELLSKLDKEKQERLKVEGELKEYKDHTIDLKNKIEEYKQTDPYDNLSPQAKMFIKRHREISEDCHRLIEKVSVMSIMPPIDLPDYILGNYKKLFHETGSMLLKSFEGLNVQSKYIDIN